MNCPGINEDFLNLYTSSERDLLVKLGNLFEEWNNVYKEYRKEKSELQNYEMIVPDGFYPNYLSQKPKILFIGRESYAIEGCNYIDLFIYEILKIDEEFIKYISANTSDANAVQKRFERVKTILLG